MIGDCYPNILSNFIPNIRRKTGQKKLTEIQLSTLSLCKCARPIYILIFFSSAVTSNAFQFFRWQ